VSLPRGAVVIVACTWAESRQARPVAGESCLVISGPFACTRHDEPDAYFVRTLADTERLRGRMGLPKLFWAQKVCAASLTWAGKGCGSHSLPVRP